MENILILYASLTGNTEEIAEILHEELQKHGCVVRKKSFDQGFIDAKELAEYDGILFGTYTYDEGSLPFEVEDFYEDLDSVDLKGKVVSVFGSGDTFYAHFALAVDTMAEKFADLGAKVVGERLKIELDPDEKDRKKCREIVDEFCNTLQCQQV
ncbi:flavodoxin [Bacillus niameyensis]|uniref:flavodoxin n=1 Tax=Bacillus niameyensis TaxID=1522308 RepID=UPI0007805478|nr:flavodoxin [Bacillus niameyensis]